MSHAYDSILGMGRSDKPIMRYSTSEMAKDVLEVLEHLGWTSERQLHILGVSMGGMIALEIVRPSPPQFPFTTFHRLTPPGEPNSHPHLLPQSN